MRNILLTGLVVSLLFVTACSSSTSAFQGQLQEANDLMNEMEYEEAISILTDLEENVIPGDSYETGRYELVAEVKSNAVYMSEHIVELEENYHDAIDAYETAVTSDEVNQELYQDAFYKLNTAIQQFGDMEELEMYQELVAARENLEEELEVTVASITDSLDESLESQNFAQLETLLNDLQIISNQFPDIVGEKVIDYNEKVEAERERFAYMPDLMDKWQEVIYENNDGSIQFEGIKNVGDVTEVVISYNGYYATIADQIDLSAEMILSNGDNVGGSYDERILTEDTVFEKYRFFHDDMNDIVSIYVELPFVQEDLLQVEFTGVDEEESFEIPGVLAVQETHQPEWGFEHSQMDVEVDSLIIEPFAIQISGVVKPKEDIELSEFSYVYVPVNSERSTRGRGMFSYSSDTEFYKNTEREFEYQYSFNEPISENVDYLDLHLFEHDFLIDPHTGEIYEENENPIFIEDLFKGNNNSHIGFDSGDQKELIHASGERVDTTSMLLKSSRTNEYYLGERFDTLTATLHLHEETTGLDYGQTEITIYSMGDEDETEIFSTTIGSDHEARDIEVDVEGVNKMRISINRDYGKEGYQEIIFENPMVE